MCGVAGLLQRSGGSWDARGILAQIAHRGPDAQGAAHVPCGDVDVWLGHTRLSILDLSEAGAQPMASRDGRWWLAFNGEVYNHQDFRAGLPGPFRGHSDTETIVESLRVRGIDATLPLLNGMYAFAALDQKERRLYLARDPFGIKPMYYHQGAERLGFASEIGALRAMGVEAALDPDALQTFLTLRYTPSPQTLLRGIHRLAPGHLLTYNLDTHTAAVRCFTRPQSGRFQGSLEDAIVAYEGELRSAVARQLLSDVPVGLLLSGGIDSALIAAMAKESGRVLTGFTVGFGQGHDECEIDDAAHTASVLGMPHRYVTVDPDKLWAALPEISASVEEPLGTTSVMPMWYLVKAAREEVTVVLTGQGSDEPWGGYRRYQQELLRSLAPWPVWRGLKRLPTSDRLPDPVRRGLRSLPVRNTARRFVQTYTLFDEAERKRLTGSASDGAARERVRQWLDWQQAGDHPIAEQQLRIDARMNLSDDLLLYGDKISMAVALEARVPMLDIALMDFVESLPLSMKVGLRRTKIVHKAMAERYLPSEIVHRKKKGFQVPFGDWCRGIWRDRVAEVLLSPGSPHLRHLDRSAIESIWAAHQRGDRGRALFSLLMFALWCRQTLAQPAALAAAR